MFTLPLFPLNTVLFPGVPLNLHIFEPRYRDLVQHCETYDEPFGVVLLAAGREARDPLAQPHVIGCTARILKVDHEDDGRMNIATIGGERFRIEELDYESKPYLIGEVESYPMKDVGENQIEKVDLLRSNLLTYLDILEGYGGVKIEKDYLPAQNNLLAYLAAFLLQVPASDKQSLLALPALSMFITQLNRLFVRELALLPTLMAPPKNDVRGFGLN